MSQLSIANGMSSIRAQYLELLRAKEKRRKFEPVLISITYHFLHVYVLHFIFYRNTNILTSTTLQVTGCYVTAAVLISFGAVYGFTSPSQILLMCFIEPFMMLINEHVGG
jgi:hypothetical protein